MLRKIVSIQLALSFIILTFSGIIMGVNNSLSNHLSLKPFHSLFAFIMIITGSIHFYLNFKTFNNYLRYRKIKIIFISSIIIIATFYLFALKLNSIEDDPLIIENNQTH